MGAWETRASFFFSGAYSDTATNSDNRVKAIQWLIITNLWNNKQVDPEIRVSSDQILKKDLKDSLDILDIIKEECQNVALRLQSLIDSEKSSEKILC